MPALWCEDGCGDARGCVSVLLGLPGLRGCPAAEGGRLLRVLLLCGSRVSVEWPLPVRSLAPVWVGVYMLDYMLR